MENQFFSEYSVHVLYDGYSSMNKLNNQMKANCTCTLIKGPLNIIVDTMTPWDSEKIIKALSSHDISPDNIDYVISTHTHPDHTGNNNLFLKAKHIVGITVSFEDIFYCDAFKNDSCYIIDDMIKVIRTPGHTDDDVTVLIKTKDCGIVAITGDLFEHYNDINNSNLWMEAGSVNPGKQRFNRLKIALMANWIIPGHGPMFSTSENIRKNLFQQL